MSFGAIAATAIGVGGSLLASSSNNRAAGDAADAQVAVSEADIAERRRQFDFVQELLNPFVEGGTSALQGALSLSGVNGTEAYNAEVERVRQSPEFTARLDAGEQSILANASATGGLRGGNTQAALAQFAPQLLADQIDTTYNRFRDLSTIGQSSAAQTGVAAQNFAAGNSAALQQQGSALAGAALARGTNNANLIGDITSLATNVLGGF